MSPVPVRSQPTMSVLGITVVLRSAKGVRISFTGIKVFTKLGVESRGQLARALPQRSADRLG